MQGLTGIKDGGVLGLLGLLIRSKVGIDLGGVPSALTAGAEGDDLNVRTSRRVASQAPDAGKTVGLEAVGGVVQGGLEAVKVHHAHVPLHGLSGLVVNGRHGVEGRVHRQARFQPGRGGGRREIIDRGRLETGVKGIEANKGAILDQVGEVINALAVLVLMLVLTLVLLVEGPVGQKRARIEMGSALVRRRLLVLEGTRCRALVSGRLVILEIFRRRAGGAGGVGRMNRDGRSDGSRSVEGDPAGPGTQALTARSRHRSQGGRGRGYIRMSRRA